MSVKDVLCVPALPRVVFANYFGSIVHVKNTAMHTVQLSVYRCGSSVEIVLISLIFI